MPWSISDVDKHRKGLNSEQKKEWVKVANGVLAQCIKDGGTDKTCAPKAIRIANSKFSDSESVPKSAFCIQDSECFAKVVDNEEKNVELIGYSGGIIKNHWWWGDLGIELSGIEFEKKFYPILEDHQTDKKIGFSQKPDTTNGTLSIDFINFVDTDCSNEFQRLSKTGFPYQASISIRPSMIERVEEGAFTEFNGRKLKGPGTVFRKSVYRETSVCVFGYDSETKSRALSEDNGENVVVQLIKEEKETKEVKEDMSIDVKKLKEEDPEAYTKLMEEVKKEVETNLSEGIAKMVTELKSSLDSTNSEVARLTKEIAIREEKDKISLMNQESNKIWETKLKASSIPEHIHPKVQSLFGYDKFVKEGKLDAESFSIAVDAEIKYWVENLGINKQVIGGGFSQKEIEEEAQNEARLAKEDDEWVKDMLGRVGQVAN